MHLDTAIYPYALVCMAYKQAIAQNTKKQVKY